jgi:hypothetical protein
MKVYRLSELLTACKDLIADAKICCADLVFKDVCLDILAKARLALTAEQFEDLRDFASKCLKEDDVSVSGRRIRIR